MTRPLQAGDNVRYTARPHWGTGAVEWVAPGGDLIHATFPNARPRYTGEFGRGELEHQPPSNTGPRLAPRT